jgi:hypothetical protein
MVAALRKEMRGFFAALRMTTFLWDDIWMECYLREAMWVLGVMIMWMVGMMA